MITQIDETGHAEMELATCPYCDKELTGSTENGMHKTCFVRLMEEWDEIDDVHGITYLREYRCAIHRVEFQATFAHED